MSLPASSTGIVAAWIGEGDFVTRVAHRFEHGLR
jgi:hypothetical protein